MRGAAERSGRSLGEGQASEEAWRERRVAAGAVTGLVLVVPLLAGFAAATLVGQALADAGTGTMVRLVLVGLTAWAVHLVVLRLARRLLPLRALLRLSLAFPGTAPARWRMGIQATLNDSVSSRLSRLRQLGPDDADVAAELAVQLAGDLSRHDAITSGHSERVRDYAVAVGRELQLSPRDLGRLRWAALLHDIGKLTVDRDILNQPGRLSEEGWEQIRTHPDNGYELIGPLQHWLGDWALGVRHHHERIDGGGYPSGLAGEEIPLSARIIAVVDAFDVMTSVRSYKDAISEDAARSELVSCAGTQFDPEVVRAFLASTVRPPMPALSVVSALPALISKPAGQVVQLAASTSTQVAGAVSAVAIVAGAQLAPLPDSARPVMAAAADVDDAASTPAPGAGKTSTVAGDQAEASDDASEDGRGGRALTVEDDTGVASAESVEDEDAGDGAGTVPPGRSGVVPARDGATPGKSADAPGRSGDAPGRSGEAPGRSGEAPGRSAEAPGRSDTAPGKPETAPGKPETAPAKPETPPAKPETPPAKPETPPAKPETPPAKPETPPAKPEPAPTKPEPAPAPSGDVPTGGGNPSANGGGSSTSGSGSAPAPPAAAPASGGAAGGGPPADR